MQSKLLTIPLTFLSVMVLTSCNGGHGPVTNPVIIERGTRLITWVVESGSLAERVRNWVTSDRELELGILLSYSSGSTSEKPSGVEEISKYELDFGDGNGWVDVTSEARNWDFGGIGREIDVNGMTRWTYSEHGEYLVRGRVTFWDGEVFTSAGHPEAPSTKSDLLVTILPEGTLEQ